MIASFRKELYSFWVTPYGLVFSASFLLFSGLSTSLLNVFSSDTHFETSTLAVLPWFLLLLLPLLTMRSFADEQSTLPLLYTCATELWEIVLGKFLATFAMLCAVVVVTLIYPIVYDVYSYVNWTNMISAYIGLLFFSAFYISIGFWVSSFAASQASAAVLSILIFLLLLLSGALLPRLPQGHTSLAITLAIISFIFLGIAFRNGLSPIILLIIGLVLMLLISAILIAQPKFLLGIIAKTGAFIAPTNHYTTFTQGLIRAADIIYFLSSAGLFLSLTILQLEKRRWL